MRCLLKNLNASEDLSVNAMKRQDHAEFSSRDFQGLKTVVASGLYG